jgi:hypothetical protein
MTPHLQTVHGKTTPRLSVTVLQIRNDRMMHVLLLLTCTRERCTISKQSSKGKKLEQNRQRTKEVGTDGVEGVGTKLVVSLHDLKDIELKAAVHVRLLRVAVSVRF